MPRKTSSTLDPDAAEETAVIEDAPDKQPQAPPAAADTDDAGDAADQSGQLELELIENPTPLSQRGSTVPEAMERLRQVPAEILNGIPDEVLSATSNELPEGERFNLMGVWLPAVYHVDGWLVCSVAAQALPTARAAHEAGRLPDEDFQILTNASARFAAADGNFSEPIDGKVVQDIRRALQNVNRAIKGEPPQTREMAEERRRGTQADKAAGPKQRREPMQQKKAGGQQSNGDGDANQMMLALWEAWKEFNSNPSNGNCRTMFDAMRPLKGSPAYSLLQAELDRRRRR